MHEFVDNHPITNVAPSSRCQQFDYPTLTDDPKEELEVSAKHPLQFFSISDVDGEDVPAATAGSRSNFPENDVGKNLQDEGIRQLRAMINDCKSNVTDSSVPTREVVFFPPLPDTIGKQ